MVSKSISITKEVYDLLDKFRLKNESFSQAIQRLVESRLDIMKLAGKWKQIPDIEPAIEIIEKVVKKVHEEGDDEVQML
ncbi:MAG: antitoxin VapB family protein [Candidatus Hodarchaeota archaeon]